MNPQVLGNVPGEIKLDLILCLGKNLNPDNSLDWILEARVKKAIEVAREHPKAKIIFSGGKYFLSADYSVSEAQAMREYAEKHSPEFKGKIITEDKSDNTIDQLCRLKRDYILPNKVKTIALVSDELHVRRAWVFLDGILGDGYTIFPVGAKVNISGHSRRAIDEIENKFLEFSVDTVSRLKRGDEESFLVYNTKHKEQKKKLIEEGKTIIEATRVRTG